ncbi:CHAT domain-containing protein [Streptomyces cavernicola]|uniref:CHAT domain-containing protein n=1 Tax=Streptomyces cavernicola TaxID=3043613 RepID=A0ABT6SM16_9ACTN|nr:CHAT domain-containing protein [Streptomyces sp. B-S-A6]MDI3409236.1 CHAT domain-containing protein [Streptomyces sp. B-S-A6]
MRDDQGGEVGRDARHAYAKHQPPPSAASERDQLVRAVRERVLRSDAGGGRVHAEAVCGGAADEELRALLRVADARTDLEARHVAGWLCAARAAADAGGLGAVHGSMAGTLLFPVWVAEPSLVPEPLAAHYAGLDTAVRPDPANADGPAQWAAECAALALVAEGRHDSPPPGASEDTLGLHELAASFARMGFPPEAVRATAVGCGSLAVLATPEYEPTYPHRCAGLARALELAGCDRPFGGPAAERAANAASAANAEPGGTELVLLTRAALRRIPADSPERPAALHALSDRLRERYLRSYDPEDLAEAVGLARDVLAQLPVDSPLLPECLSSLGKGLLLWLQREGATVEACDELVDVCRRAVPRNPAGPAITGQDLGSALLVRAQYTGLPADLDEAVAVLREALGAAAEPFERAMLRRALGNALRSRHVMTGDPRDLEEALALTAEAGEAAEAAEAGEPGAPGGSGGAGGAGGAGAPQPSLLVRAMALYSRHIQDPQADGGVLEAALRLLCQARDGCPPGHPDRPVTLNDLGLVLRASYEHSGSLDRLNEAVRAHREAVTLTPDGHALLGLRLLNLGAALSLRNQLTEDGEDLREAQECRRRAAALPGLGARHRAALAASLGISLAAGYERTADPHTQLDEAVGHLRQAVALTPGDDPMLPQRRLNLALVLLTRIGLTLRVEEAREARDLADQVIATVPAHSPVLPRALTVAANARLLSPRALLSPSGPTEAIALFRRSVEVTPPGHPQRTLRMTNLGSALRHGNRMRGRRRRAQLAEAAEVFEAAAREEQCNPWLRLDAARSWGETRAELGDWERALDGYVTAVDLLPSVAPSHLVRDDQEFQLSRTVGLGAAAAACAVRCGRPGLAVGLLEQARGVILSHAFDADSDLTRLREQAPDLAERFTALRDALDRATLDVEQAPLDEGAGPLDQAPQPSQHAEADRDTGQAQDDRDTRHAQADRRQRLAAEWRDLTQRIRAEHPDLGLLRPVREWDERELREVARPGPVVLVNVDSYGSHALVVTERAVDAVPLPRIEPDAVAGRRRAFQDALLRIGAQDTSRDQSLRAQRTVHATLSWLWETVTGPVLDHLGAQAGERVWWSPGGGLGTLPLHAAAPAEGARGALDRVVSSYTPTLRALHHARLRCARTAGSGALVVAVTAAEGLAPLPAARREAAEVARLLPGAEVLTDGAATRAAVVGALPRYAYAHFACHALGDLGRPSGSRLVLDDHGERPLTVRDLARLRLPSVRLAYLSACDTLGTSPELADEAVHIVGALQIAGFPHVIGSLWHVDDTIGADVARSVYESLATGDGGLDVGRAAEALHTAVRALRDTYPRTPSLWACQVHAGP